MSHSPSEFPDEITDFRAYEAAPGIGVILRPDVPVFTNVTCTNDFIAASGITREQARGKGHFDLFPRNPDDLNFSGYIQLRASFEFVLMNKIPHSIPVQRYDIPNQQGGFTYKYWEIRNAPLLGGNGEVQYIIHSAVDITEKVNAQEKVEAIKDIEKAYQFFMSAPVIISIVKGDNHVIELANDGMLEVWGRGSEVIGKKLLDAVPELKGQGFIEMLNEVRSTGKPYKAFESPSTLIRNGREEVLYFDFIYHPFYEDDPSKAAGVIGVAHDVTEQVLARKQVAEVTAQLNFRNAIFEAQNEATTDGVLIVDAQGKMIIQNSRFAQIWKMPREVIESKDDELAQQHAMSMLVDPLAFKERIDYLYANRKEKSYDLIHFKDGRVIERTGTPVNAENGLYYGWAWYFRDITDRIKQEQKFRNVIEQAPDPILIMKGDDMVLEVANKALFQLWNVDETALGKKFLDVRPKMKGQGFLELLQDVYHTGNPFHEIEVPAVSQLPDGGTKEAFFNFTYQPYREATGEITGVLVTAIDVTNQVQSRRKIEQSEKTLRTFVNSVSQLAWMANGDGWIYWYNERWYQYTGTTLEEMEGWGWEKVHHPDHRDRIVEFAKEAWLKNEPFELTFPLRRHDGEFRWFLTRVFPITDDDGKIVQWIGTNTDIHEQKLSAEILEATVKERTAELEKLNEDLKRSNTNLEEFAYAASHDLKEPIRKISTFSDKLQGRLSDKLDEEENRLFERMKLASQRMTNLIDDLLTYSQASAGAGKMDLIDLNETVDSVLEDLELQIEQQGAKVNAGDLPSVRGNARQFHQMFQNLIENGLKYRHPDTAPVVEIRSGTISWDDIPANYRPEKNDVSYHLLTVDDNGIGFAQEDAEKIFQVFTRLHSNRDFKGTGIGLSIVRKVIENHNGCCWAEGEPGKGATFFIALPASSTA